MRAVAVGAVFIFHFLGYNKLMPSVKSHLLTQGWLGANLFFVISGFVIALSCFRSLAREPQDFRRRFLTKRAARILPLYYLTSIVFTAAFLPDLFVSRDGLTALALYATLTFNFFSATSGWINSPAWSIAVEVQFYILLALAAPALRRLPVTVILVGAVAVAALWDLAWQHWTPATDPNRGYNMFFLTTQLPGMLDTFFFGLALARIASDPDKKAIWDWASERWGLLLGGAIACLLFAHFVYHRIPPSYDSWRIAYSSATLLAHHFSTTAGFCLLVFTVAVIRSQLLDRMLAPLRYIGVISYGIYLWHVIVILGLRHFPDLGTPLRLVLTLALTVAVSALSWHFFELPILRRFGSNALHTGTIQPAQTDLGHGADTAAGH